MATQTSKGLPGSVVILIIVVGFFVVIAIVSKISGSVTSNLSAEVDSIQAAEAAKKKREQVFQDSIKLVSKAQAAQQVEELKKRFIKEQDEFNKADFYTHKTFGIYWQDRVTLTAYTNGSGFVFLKSNYFSDDWIFHDQITLLLEDGSTMSSSVVPRYDKNHVTKVVNGGVYEVITYTDDEVLWRTIAAQADKKIKVRFHGQDFVRDITLSKADKKAIKETVELADALKLVSI